MIHSSHWKLVTTSIQNQLIIVIINRYKWYSVYNILPRVEYNFSCFCVLDITSGNIASRIERWLCLTTNNVHSFTFFSKLLSWTIFSCFCILDISTSGNTARRIEKWLHVISWNYGHLSSTLLARANKTFYHSSKY